MTISVGTKKLVAAKLETQWAVLPGATGAKLLRRVTSNFNLAKDTYESAEITQTRQVSDMRHGQRKAEGSINGELSPGSYSQFIGSVLCKDFASAPTAASLSVTIAASGSLYTVTRAAGSFLTDGFLVGQVVRLSGGTLNAANSNKNLVIASMTATVLTVSVLNGSTLVSEGPIASVTVTAAGKVSSVPLTGHTDQSYTIEEFYQDIAVSEIYAGCKPTSFAIQLPSTGLSTIDLSFMGKDLTQTGSTQYFTSPTAASSTGIFAAVNGVVLVQGAPVALITSMDLTVEKGAEAAVAIGSNSAADILTGRVRASGSMTVYFTDSTYREYFNQETPVSIVVTLSTDSTANADFMSFTLPKVKLGSFTKSDAELGVTASCSFTALLNNSGTGAQTTVMIQDSQA